MHPLARLLAQQFSVMCSVFFMEIPTYLPMHCTYLGIEKMMRKPEVAHVKHVTLC